MLRRMLAVLFAGVVLATPAAAQTLDEVLAKNFEARGGKDKLKAVQTVRATGRMGMGQGMEAPFVMEFRRPNKFRMEFTLQGMTAVTAYDGKTGWQVMPFMGKKDPEPMSEEDLKNVEDEGDWEGPLVDWKEKGHQVELIGKEKVEGTDAYKLKVTKKNGDVTMIYLDADAYLQIKEEGKRTIRGQEFEFETSMGDYKEVGGLVLPHSMESKAKGQPGGQVVTIDKIEIGADVPDTRFVMPEVKKEEPKPAEEKKPGGARR